MGIFKGLQLVWEMGFRNQVDECNLKYSEMYLNRKDVQKALHARLVGTTKYRLCSKMDHQGHSQNPSMVVELN
ncbi:hypothetical protein glysoja_046059 [Glycine soja]|uniref:Uncharacterized protein n=1 Tax=Glycine soja TaxID=3848 RepID=A0A0B2PQE0_GLYSO|nr:hypothetical protein JHK87_044623 [Glycine soja]KHN09919.1 hypothetical protein glysoja_046059 [Glycine soja]